MLRLYVVFLLLISSSASAFEFQAFRSANGRNIEISDVYYSSSDVNFSFILEASEFFSGEIEYSKNGVTLLKSAIELYPADRLTFPEAGKYIALEDYGSYTFKLYEGNKIVEKRSIILKPAIDTTLKVTNEDTTADSSLKTNYKSKQRYRVFNYRPQNISLPRVRSTGSKVFKEYSNSVVLVATDDGVGSGSIISENGLVLTNWHVVGDVKEALIVFRPLGFASVDTGENYLADVLKVDPKTDLALLQLRHLTRKLNPIKIASPETIEIAEDVHAIGHPKGNYWTYTRGVISQIRPQFEWTGDGELVHFADVIQTQTPINPGNSGGPLLDDEGAMVGVNSFGDQGADGLNYAVAATTVRSFVSSIPDGTQNQTQDAEQTNLIRSRDSNSDGNTDTWYLDLNNNGKIDCIEQDTNFDGEIDVVFMDENENGTAEMIFDYILLDGEVILIISIDHNEDGLRDQIAYDYDMDGNIDKIEDA